MAEKRAKRPRRQTEEKLVDVSIVVLNFNTKKLTVECVESIIATTKSSEYEIIVVDNASTDGSVEYLKKKLPKKVKLVVAARNLGFGPGNNLGVQSAKGDYLFFVNSDTILLPGCVDNLVAFADAADDYSILGPRVLLDDKKTIQPASFGWLPNLYRTIFRRSQKNVLNNSHLNTDTEWVTGAALFIPRNLFEQVGGFDSRYFMYFEDQDLCASVVSRGGKITVVHDAEIIHLGGKSIGKKKVRYQYYDASQVKYFLKHEGVLATGLMILFRLPWRWFKR